MGSEQDIKPGDNLRRALLAVRNIGYGGASTTCSLERWAELVDDLVKAAKMEGIRDSKS